MKSSAFRSNGHSGMKLGLLASTSLATRHLMLFARETARSKADVSDEHFRTSGKRSSRRVPLLWAASVLSAFVTVSGVGSQWNNASSLYVGDNGKGTLNITAGGVVSNAESAIIGIYAGSTGMVTISGTGSQWYVATASTEARQYGFIVGHYGNGTLKISDGGLVSNAVGYVGHNFGSTGKVTVSGAGSQWSNSFELYVGIIGSGGLNITDGGAVSSAGGYISYGADSTGTATVSGGGSRWANSFDLYVGQDGNGKLKITDGGVVSGEIGYIGGLAGGTGTVAVSGAGSQWSSFDDVYVGFEGSGTLTIQTGGAVSAMGLFIADDVFIDRHREHRRGWERGSGGRRHPRCAQRDFRRRERHVELQPHRHDGPLSVRGGDERRGNDQSPCRRHHAGRRQRRLFRRRGRFRRHAAGRRERLAGRLPSEE